MTSPLPRFLKVTGSDLHGRILRITKVERRVERPILNARLDRTTVRADLNLPQPPSVRPEFHQEDLSFLALRPAQAHTVPSRQDTESRLTTLGIPLSAEAGQRIRVRIVKTDLLQTPRLSTSHGIRVRDHLNLGAGTDDLLRRARPHPPPQTPHPIVMKDQIARLPDLTLLAHSP